MTGRGPRSEEGQEEKKLGGGGGKRELAYLEDGSSTHDEGDDRTGCDTPDGERGNPLGDLPVEHTHSTSYEGERRKEPGGFSESTTGLLPLLVTFPDDGRRKGGGGLTRRCTIADEP
jgi:hypothetical protein